MNFVLQSKKEASLGTLFKFSKFYLAIMLILEECPPLIYQLFYIMNKIGFDDQGFTAMASNPARTRKMTGLKS